MFKEFKEFALKGNVTDMAVGIVIGAAFGAIVNSLVGDIIMPLVGLATGGADFSNQFLLLRDGTPAGPYVTLAAARTAGAVTINLGAFLTLVLNFLIVAFALFLVVKGMNAAKREQAAAPAPPPAAPAPSTEERLLTEIRDLLKSR
jgi:large conductance mechanosensitive channel